MIVAYLLQILLVYVRQKPLIKIIFFFSLVLSAFYLFLYSLSLESIGRDVWFSDAEYYWQGRNNRPDSIFSYQRLLWDINFFGATPSIARYINWILVLGAILNFKNLLGIKLTKARSMVLFVFVLCNPYFLFSLSRILKDSLFLYMVSLLMLIIVYARNYSILSLPIFSFALGEIRPWAFILPYTLYGIDWFFRTKSNFKKLIFLSFVFVSFFALFKNEYVRTWVNYINSGSLENFSLSLPNRLLGLGKIFISPGFYRLLNAKTYFIYYNGFMLLSIGLGLALNYFYMSLFVLNRKLIGSRTSIMMLSYITTAVLVYAFAYGGSVEFRIKSVVLIPVFLLFLNNIIVKRKQLFLRLFLFYFVILIMSIYGF